MTSGELASRKGQQIILTIDRANGFLDRANTLEEVVTVKTVADMAAAAARAKKSTEALDKALKLKAKCERKAGAYLRDNLESGRPPNNSKINVPNMEHFSTLKDLGISRHDSSRWQQIASIPEPEFDNYVSNTRRVTQGALLHLAQKTTVSAAAKKSHPLPTGRFEVIYADPPWPYDFELRGAPSSHYPEMTVEDISALKVPAADDSILFLWATNPKLPEALDVMWKWGFEYKTNLVWVKDRFGTGYYVRGKHELLLIGTRGQPGVPATPDRPESVFVAPRGKHSEKPSEFYGMIEKMYPQARYLEMFARQNREGWTAWGNEAN